MSKKRIKTINSLSKEDFDTQVNFHLEVGWKLVENGLKVTGKEFIQVMMWIDDENKITKFHDNGQIKSQEKIKDKEPYKITKMYSNGSLLSILIIRSEGNFYRDWYKNGNKKFEKRYWVDGTIREENKFLNNRLSEKTRYYPNGQKEEIEKFSKNDYIESNNYDFRQKWNEDGSLESIQDRKNQIYKFWYKDHRYTERKNSKNGDKVLYDKEWFEEGGQLLKEIKYYDPETPKEEIFYHQNGNIEGIKSYRKRIRWCLKEVKWYYESGLIKSEEYFDEMGDNCYSMKIYDEDGTISVDWTSEDEDDHIKPSSNQPKTL
tara:strand:- start:492 stop:1445 length:954 start_codon:yes stop_codon:yes gene_type:complete